MRVKWNRSLDGGNNRQQSGSLQGSDFEAGGIANEEEGDKINSNSGFFGLFRNKRNDVRKCDDGQSLCSLTSSNAEPSSSYFQRHASLPVRWKRRPMLDSNLFRRGSTDSNREYIQGGPTFFAEPTLPEEYFDEIAGTVPAEKSSVAYPGSSLEGPDNSTPLAKSSSLSECQPADTEASRQHLPNFSQSIKSLASVTGSASSEKSNFFDAAKGFFSRSKSVRKSKSESGSNLVLKRSISVSDGGSSATLPPKSPPNPRSFSRIPAPCGKEGIVNGASNKARSSSKFSDFFSSFRIKGKPSDREFKSGCSPSKLPRKVKNPPPVACKAISSALVDEENLTSGLTEHFVKCANEKDSENAKVLSQKNFERYVDTSLREVNKNENFLFVQYQIDAANNVLVTNPPICLIPSRAQFNSQNSDEGDKYFEDCPLDYSGASGLNVSIEEIDTNYNSPSGSRINHQNFSISSFDTTSDPSQTENLFSPYSNDSILSSANSDYDNRTAMTLKQDAQVPLFRNGVSESIDSVLKHCSRRCENENFALLDKARKFSNTRSSLEMILKSFDTLCVADPSDSIVDPSSCYLNNMKEIGILQKADPGLRNIALTKDENDDLISNSFSQCSNYFVNPAVALENEIENIAIVDVGINTSLDCSLLENLQNDSIRSVNGTACKECLSYDVDKHRGSDNNENEQISIPLDSHCCETREDISRFTGSESVLPHSSNINEQKTFAIDCLQESSIVCFTDRSCSEKRVDHSDTLRFTEEANSKGFGGERTCHDYSGEDLQSPVTSQNEAISLTVNETSLDCSVEEIEPINDISFEIQVSRNMHGLDEPLDNKERPMEPSGLGDYTLLNYVSTTSPMNSLQNDKTIEKVLLSDAIYANFQDPPFLPLNGIENQPLHATENEIQESIFPSYEINEHCLQLDFSVDDNNECCPCCGEIPSPRQPETNDNRSYSCTDKEPLENITPLIDEALQQKINDSEKKLGKNDTQIPLALEVSDAQLECVKGTMYLREKSENELADETHQRSETRVDRVVGKSKTLSEKSGKKKKSAREIQKPKTVVVPSFKSSTDERIEKTNTKTASKKHRTRTKSNSSAKIDEKTHAITLLSEAKSKDDNAELFSSLCKLASKTNSKSTNYIPCTESQNFPSATPLFKCKSEEILSSHIRQNRKDQQVVLYRDSSPLVYQPVEINAKHVTTVNPQIPPKVEALVPSKTPQGVGQVLRPGGEAGIHHFKNLPLSTAESKLSTTTAMPRAKSSKIPRKQLGTSPRPLVAPRPVRPPMWLSKAELSQEIQHLSTLCETRTKELNKLKMETRHVTAGFDALAVVIRYMSAELDAFKVPGLITDLKLAEEKIEKGRTDLKYYEKEIQRVNMLHMKEMNKISEQLSAEYESSLKEITEKHAREMGVIKEEQMKEVTCLDAALQASCEEEKLQHLKMLEDLQQELQKQREEMEIFHQHELNDLEELHLGKQKALLDEIEKLQKQCSEAKQLSLTVEEALQKDTDTKLQWLTAKKTDLQNEVDSLKAVLEIKNNELHALRKENLEMQKELEELPLAKEKIKMLQARAEDLQALVAEKVKTERQLSTEHEFMKETYEKEAKVNMRLSMENEELLWRLKQANESSLLSTTLPDECEPADDQDTDSSWVPVLSEEPTPPPSPTKNATPVKTKFFTFMSQDEINSLSPKSPRTQYKRIQPHKSPQAKHVTKSIRTPRRETDSSPHHAEATPRKLARHQNHTSLDEGDGGWNRDSSVDEQVENECFGLPVSGGPEERLRVNSDGQWEIPDEDSPENDCAIVDPKSFYQMAFPVGETSQDNESEQASKETKNESTSLR